MADVKQAPGPRIACAHCDDTGDVHRADGEYLGRCACPAGEWSKRDREWHVQAVAEQRAEFAAQQADDEAMRKALAGFEPCSNCSGTGFDAEPDGFGGAIGGQCAECRSTGFVAIANATESAALPQATGGQQK